MQDSLPSKAAKEDLYFESSDHKKKKVKNAEEIRKTPSHMHKHSHIDTR